MSRKDDKTLKWAVGLIDAAEKNQRRHAQNWKRWESVYKGPSYAEALSGATNGRSNVCPPWVYQQVETIKPRIIDRDPQFTINPAEPQDERAGRLLNQLIRYQLEQNDYETKQLWFAHDGMVKALGVAKVVWLYETQTITRRRARTPEDVQTGNDPRETVQVVTKNWPGVLYVDPNDYLWDPAATCDEDMRYAVHRVWPTIEDLEKREKEGKYQNVGKIGNGKSGSENASRGWNETSDEAEERRGDRIEVMEIWTRDRVVTIANRSVVLRDEPNPYWHGKIPFVTIRTQPVQGSLVGISEVETVEALQEHLWTMRNLRIDAAKLAIHKQIVVDPTVKNASQIGTRMGGKIYARPDQIQPLAVDTNMAPSYDEEMQSLNDMQLITGATPPLQGEFGSGATATTSSLAVEGAGERMTIKRKMMKLFGAKIATLMVQLNYQFMDDKYAVRVAGPEGQEWQSVSPDDIPLVLDVIPDTSDGEGSQVQRRNGIVEAMNVVAPMNGVPLHDGTTFTVKPFLRELVRSYGHDPEEYFAAIPQPTMGPMGEPVEAAPNGGAEGAPPVPPSPGMMQ